jgi:hypothetical protein
MTDPADIVSVLQQAAQTLIGQGVSAADAQVFVVYYHQLEQAAQTQSSPVTVAAPSIYAAASEWIQQRYRTEVLAHRAAEVGNEIQNIINSHP